MLKSILVWKNYSTAGSGYEFTVNVWTSFIPIDRIHYHGALPAPPHDFILSSVWCNLHEQSTIVVIIRRYFFNMISIFFNVFEYDININIIFWCLADHSIILLRLASPSLHLLFAQPPDQSYHIRIVIIIITRKLISYHILSYRVIFCNLFSRAWRGRGGSYHILSAVAQVYYPYHPQR